MYKYNIDVCDCGYEARFMEFPFGSMVRSTVTMSPVCF